MSLTEAWTLLSWQAVLTLVGGVAALLCFTFSIAYDLGRARTLTDIIQRRHERETALRDR